MLAQLVAENLRKLDRKFLEILSEILSVYCKTSCYSHRHAFLKKN